MNNRIITVIVIIIMISKISITMKMIKSILKFTIKMIVLQKSILNHHLIQSLIRLIKINTKIRTSRHSNNKKLNMNHNKLINRNNFLKTIKKIMKIKTKIILKIIKKLYLKLAKVKKVVCIILKQNRIKTKLKTITLCSNKIRTTIKL